MVDWRNWDEGNSIAILDSGNPLRKIKQINGGGIPDIKNQLTAYIIVEAESNEAAARLFLNHPHFSIFPGDSVEVMEWLPTPSL